MDPGFSFRPPPIFIGLVFVLFLTENPMSSMQLGRLLPPHPPPAVSSKTIPHFSVENAQGMWGTHKRHRNLPALKKLQYSDIIYKDRFFNQDKKPVLKIRELEPSNGHFSN